MNEWEQLEQKLDINVCAWIPDDTKQKIVDSARAIYSANSIYEHQMRAKTFVRHIEISRMLGQNEIIVPILIKEYAELMFCFKTVSALLQTMKQTPAPIKMVLDAIKLDRPLSSRLYDDLQLLISKYNVKIDVTKCMTEYKAFNEIPIDAVLKAAKHKDFAVKGFVDNAIIKTIIGN